MRARVSCTSGWSRIAQLPAGERHEDVFQRGVVGGEERELGAPPLQEAEQRGDGAMHLGHGERSEEHTSELQSPCNLVCRLLLEKKKRAQVVFTVSISPFEDF